MKKFSWGLVIKQFNYDFDGNRLTIIKYYPWKREGITILSGKPDYDVIMYHCEDLHESAYSIQYLLISWIAHTNIGLNQHSLVAGVAKALEIR